MNKIAIALSALMFSTAALADITIVNPSSKASPATTFAMAYKDAVGASSFYQSQTCEDAEKVFNNTKNAVMIYNSSIEFAARDKGLNCKLEGVKPSQVIFVGKQYMKVCTAKNNGSDFKASRLTMGMASMYSTKKHEADFRSTGINLILIPFAGSRDILQAVVNRDINFGYIGSSMADRSQNLDCIYSTNPVDPNYIGKSLNLKVPDFRITMLIYTNSTDTNVLKILRSAQLNEQFVKFLETSGTVANWNIDKNDVDDVIKFVDTIFINWAK